MSLGLKHVNGSVAVPPYTNGPYIWHEHVTFPAGVAGAVTKGNVWFVDGTSGNNGNDGKSWSTAKATVAAAISAAGTTGDVIYIAPGSYDETVTVNKAKLTIIGTGGRGSVFIEPSAAGAEGMQVTADDVTLVNVGVDGDDTADYGLNVNSASRFRAYGCKFELGDGTGPAVKLDGTATDQTADALFRDCEFAWAGIGIQGDDSAHGYPTQIFVEQCKFHNIATACIGVAADGLFKNLIVTDCVFDQKEDGTEPTDFVLLSDNGNTGVFANNRFAIATNDTAKLTIGTGLMWVANYTEAGTSTARPA